MTGKSAYERLAERFRRHAALGEAAGVLHWDLRTMMPVGGAGARSEQLTALDLTRHELLCDPATEALLDEAEADRDRLEPWRLANLREMRRLWRHATAVPADLVAAHARATHRCEMLWREARPLSDFALVRSQLKQVLDLTRAVGAAKAAEFDCPLYDALLDQYEPGGRAEAIDALFADLAAFLPEFTGRVLERQMSRPAPIQPPGPFPLAKQEELSRSLMTTLGFDFAHGRLDISLHPFCGGVPEDVRITTRYDEADFAKALMAVLHETGHALYERGLPAEWRLQPVGEARGMVLHESQSLLIEMQACRSREFIAFLAPLARDLFEGSGPAWSADNLAALAGRVERGLIRVDADEVTYPAHVILRYRLERAMLSGDLPVEDLPGAWNEGLRGSLGIAPPDDRSGCLQDIHWYDGAWGYFPTYTLGALAAAQLFATAREALPGLPEAIARGEFKPLLDWLQAKVHGLGSLFTTDEVVARATGAPLGTAAFKAHLAARYPSA